jgi:hypothetical protein
LHAAQGAATSDALLPDDLAVAIRIDGRHSVATLFGQVTMRLPRFRCGACGRIETGLTGPSHCRSTPELDRLRAHPSALMSYQVTADLLRQMFPVDAGMDPETLRRPHPEGWRRARLRVGTAITEGTPNCLVNRRMNKSQQMRWSRREADPLLQVRCAVDNGTFGSDYGQRFHSANDSFPPAAIAALPPVLRWSLPLAAAWGRRARRLSA